MPYSLPRRRHAAPVFHFNESSSDTDEDERASLPQLKLRSRPTSFHGAPTVAIAPPVQRTNSSPILLSNGKPLKSSLKASASSPDMPARGSPRVRASSTAALEGHVAKNVHFPSSDLATVRFYSRSARPASLSLADPAGDTETETETERPAVHELDAAQSSAVPAASPATHANVHLESLMLQGPSAGGSDLALKGTLLVRNLAYQKTVAVRFTLDNWDTTSEVLAHYSASLPALPHALYSPGSGLHRPPPEPLPECASPVWDRFTFSIRLDDYAPSLAARTLWLVARYSTPAVPEVDAEGEQPAYEWWDNNSGKNYRVAFKLKHDRPPPRFPTPPPPVVLRAPPSPTQTRLRTLSLSNYAAPTSPTSPTAPMPRSPALSTSAFSEGSPSSLATPVDLVNMEMVNGFPATGPSGVGFGAVGLALDLGGRTDDASEEEKGRDVALYWPWARPRPHPHDDHDDHDDHDHAVRVHSPPPPPRRHLHPHTHMHTMKNLPTRKHTQQREPSPPLSDSSSSSDSSSGSSAGSGSGSARRPRVGRRVFPPLSTVGGGFAALTSENGYKSTSTPTPRESAQDGDRNKNKNQDKDDADGGDKKKIEQDKIYQALVKKWCFAGPHAQGQRPHSPSPSHPHAQHGHGMGMGVVR